MADLPYLEEQIGDHHYRCVALPMKQWSELSEYLSKVLGDPISSVIQGFEVTDLRELILGDPAAFAKLLGTFADKLTTRVFLALIGHMALSLKVMDDRGTFQDLDAKTQDFWWASNREELAPVVWLFLRSQYQAFFKGFAGFMPIKNAKPESPSVMEKNQGGV